MLKDAQSPFQETLSEVRVSFWRRPRGAKRGWNCTKFSNRRLANYLRCVCNAASHNQQFFIPRNRGIGQALFIAHAVLSVSSWILVTISKEPRALSRSETLQLGLGLTSSTLECVTGQTSPSGQTS
jgi:hypothetical protein